MTKVFIPQVGSTMEMRTAGTLSLCPYQWNSTAAKKIVERMGLIQLRGYRWIDAATNEPITGDTAYDVVFPEGTIFKITKVDIKTGRQATDSITLRIVYSPDPTINKSGKIVAKVGVLNSLDMGWITLPEKSNG